MHDEQRWQAVLTHDATADGTFVYAVRSTGIYCRPSCSSRRPRREMVSFFTTPDEAEAATFRACKRCRPQGSTTETETIIQRVRGYIEEHLDESLTLAMLGALVHLSPFHLQRLFTREVGMSPRAYADALRVQRLKTQLHDGADIATAQYASGYLSSSRLYERANGYFGMTPGQYRRGGAGMTIRYDIASSPLGHLLIARTERGICAVKLGNDEEVLVADLTCEYPKATIARDTEAIAEVMASFTAYLAGQSAHIDVPLDVQGTAFQWRVWRALTAIPFGQTRTYQDIAESIGEPTAARAVGSACASNHTALIIPCHRAVRTDGGLGGYRWGLPRKEILIAQERELAESLP